MSKQSDLQITQLRQKVLKQKQTIDSLKSEQSALEEKYKDVYMQREVYYKQCEELRKEAEKFEQTFDRRVNEKINQLNQNVDSNQKEFERLKQENKNLKIDKEKLQIEKDDYKEKFAAMKQKNKNIEVNDQFQNYIDEKLQYKNELAKEKKNLQQLRSDMEDILAENRVLRKLAKVPDNYGFNLEDIKLAEKNKIEDYKKKVRRLETEVEELEKERTYLRSKIRSGTFKRGDAGAIEQYEESSSNKHLKDEIQALKDQLREAQQDSNKQYNQDNTVIDELKNELLNKMQEMMNKQQQFQSTMQFNPNEQQEMESTQNIVIQNYEQQPLAGAQLQQPMYQQNELQPFMRHGQQPYPIPGKFGDNTNINEGYTNRFGENGQKVPVDMYDLHSESGFDQVQAKQEIATLQLMNLENMKILTEKQQEYKNLHDELVELREEYEKMLLLQDNLFEQHFTEKSKLEQQIESLDQQNLEKESTITIQQIKIDSYEKDIDDIRSRDQSSLNEKIATMTKRKAVLEVNMIQLSRKYDALKDEYDDMSEKYLNQEMYYSDKEQKYIHRIQSLIDWKKRASTQLSILLAEQKKSVPEDEHQTLQEQYQDMKDKFAASQTELGILKGQVGTLKGAEREVQEKNETLNLYQEEMNEITIEMEVIKKRLIEVDDLYRKFSETFQRLVDNCKENNLSPLEVFQQFDKNGDGKLGKTEFAEIMDRLQVNVDQSEIDIVFMFLDLDGTQSIEPNEFLRKLRRAGVSIRKKEEEIVYDLYQKIKNLNYELKDLFIILDIDGDNNIAKDELGKGLTNLGISITNESLDYIFKMADISGDGAISYDEFRTLFDNILQDTIRESINTNETELDVKKQIILKIDNAVREMGYSLIDIYKIIDQDEDQKITIAEFKKLFKKIRLEMPPEDMETLFREIDKDNDQSIEYNELLAYVRNAKKEQAKIERMKKINARVAEIKDNQFENKREQEGVYQQTGIERLQMKISMLELRDKNSQSRNETQKKKIAQLSKEIVYLEMKVGNLESDLVKSHQSYFKSRQKCTDLQEKLNCCIPKVESEKINALKTKMLTENSELKAALATYKNLYEYSVNHVKTIKVQEEKKKNHYATLKELQNNIKDQQGTSDDKALIGKLYHQLMVSRWQQGEINKKFDRINDESLNIRKEKENLLAEVQDKEYELMDIHQEYNSLKKEKDKEINEIKGKILPTVSLHKIEEIHNKLAEVVQQKIDLEITNRKFRDINNELQLKCDYYETNKQTMDDIMKELKTTNIDSHQQKIMEQGQIISELKLSEMKSKREAAMAKEKEEYYQRINRQHTESIKLMEQEITQNQKKFNEREDFWRKRVTQSDNLFLKKKEEKEKAKQQEKERFSILGQAKYKNNNTEQNIHESEDQQNLASGRRTSVLGNNDRLKELENNYQIIEEEKTKLLEENNRLELLLKQQKIESGNLMSKQSRQTNHDQRDIEEITKKAIDEEAEKIAKVAQTTIKTLQNLIEEKNQEISQKERKIEKMNNDFLHEKEQDLAEIRKLNNQLVNQNMTTMQKMNQSIVQHNGQVVESSNYWGDVGQLLIEKDNNMKDLSERCDREIVNHKKTIKLLKEEQQKTEELQQELYTEQKRNETGKLLKEVDQYKKLIKQKNDELVKLKKMFDLIKKDSKQVYEKSGNQKSLMDKVIKDDKGKLVQMEQQLKDALDHVKKSKLQIQKNNEDIESMRLTNIKQLGEINELKEENRKYRSGELVPDKDKKRSGSRQDEDIAKVLKSGKNKDDKDQSEELQKNKEQLDKLEEENKDLKKQLEFIRKQKSKEGIIDEDGVLKPKGLRFNNMQEIAQAINRWIRMNDNWDIMKELKTKDTKNNGAIPLTEFYQVLESGGIKLKDSDKNIIKNTDMVNSLKQIDLVDFAYALKPNLKTIKLDAMNTEEKYSQSQQQQVRKQSSLQQKSVTISKDTKEEARKEQTTQFLEKKLRTVDRQLNEARTERDMKVKELQKWKEKALRLEKELQSASSNPRLQTMNKRQSTTQANAIGELKDTIYNMEDQNENMKMSLYRKDVEIQKLGEEKNKLEEELKQTRLEISKQRSKMDNWLSSKIGNEELKRENTSEKDNIIRNLKEKLEESRQLNDQKTEEYYEMLNKNKELEYIKENFDIQVERLQGRIVELQEYKKLQGFKTESPPPQQTLKKGFSRR